MYVPLGSTVALTVSISLHPRSLRACAEPRRASARLGDARLGEAPLAYGVAITRRYSIQLEIIGLVPGSSNQNSMYWLRQKPASTLAPNSALLLWRSRTRDRRSRPGL